MKFNFLLLLVLVVNNSIFSQSNLEDKVINDSVFIDIKTVSSDFVLDMKYATDDNFLKSKVYDCEVCLLRKSTVEALLNANKKFMRKGYRIKFFDCYRPLDVQRAMWKIVSDPNYVANPAKGSIHNRGGAVDITLVDDNGVELDMGTSFDHFGSEASHNYSDLPKEVLKNRKLLKKIMIKSGFESFDSEWWHYNLVGSRKFPLSNFKWNCN